LYNHICLVLGRERGMGQVLRGLDSNLALTFACQGAYHFEGNRRWLRCMQQHKHLKFRFACLHDPSCSSCQSRV